MANKNYTKQIIKGDDSLKGDKGKEIVQKLEENVKANPNVSEETKANAEETAKTEAVNEPAKPVRNSKPAEPAKTTSHAPAPKPAAQAPKQPASVAKVRKPIGYYYIYHDTILNTTNLLE